MTVGTWVALDVASREAAEAWMERLKPHRQYKVGLELFTRVGPETVREWVARGLDLFLDLKLHDIPNTVRGAVQAAHALGVRVLTVHIAGGDEMLRQAVEAAEGRPVIAGVTVLTSLSADTAARLGVPPPDRWALSLTALAVAAGVPAVVASAAEVEAVKRTWPDLRVIVPGIRLPGDAAHDQARIATPADAVAAGADDLVVGRTVLAAADPAAALRAVEEGIRHGLARRVARDGGAPGGAF
jgi:orotidine-5'-phosphate decarboxylase